MSTPELQTAPVTKTPLYRNVNVLSWVFQVAVFLVVLAVLLFLWGNYLENTRSSGIPTSFDFVDDPAGFSIPGADFTSTQSVQKAYTIGLLNTIRVSILGIVLATFLGILIGVGRLSRNWIVAKLTAAYVEAIRNIPLIVLMTFAFLAVVLQVLPAIDDAWRIDGLAIISNRAIGIPWYQGVSGFALVGALAAGAAGWWLLARWRHGVRDRTGESARAGLWGGGFFLLAVIIAWSVLGAEVTLPEVDGRQIVGGIRIDPSYFAVLIALVVYTASHIAEIVRGSIQAVPKGQGEAASALALTGFQRTTLIILPQAMRVAIPPLGNQYLNLIKNSSLGAAFSYFELTNVTQVAVGNGAPAVPAFTLALFFYVALSLFTSFFVNMANRRFELVER